MALFITHYFSFIMCVCVWCWCVRVMWYKRTARAAREIVTSGIRCGRCAEALSENVCGGGCCVRVLGKICRATFALRAAYGGHVCVCVLHGGEHKLRGRVVYGDAAYAVYICIGPRASRVSVCVCVFRRPQAVFR